MTVYAIAQDVADYLGRPLTDAEAAQVDVTLDAASGFADRYTGRSWGSPTVTGELHTLFGTTLLLKRTPVASVQAVTSRSAWIGAVPTALVAGTGYELLDPSTGLMRVRSYRYSWDYATDYGIDGRGLLISVNYTVSGAVPAEIVLATTILAIDFLQPTIDPNSLGIDSYQIGRELQIKYTTAADMPGPAKRLLDVYRRAVVFS